MVPNFVAASAREFACVSCGKPNQVHPGELSGQRRALAGVWPPNAAKESGPQANAPLSSLESGLSTTAKARELLRLERENPSAWDFGIAMARMALDSRSPTLVKMIHDNGEEGTQFYAEEVSGAIPEALREAVMAGELDVPRHGRSPVKF